METSAVLLEKPEHLTLEKVGLKDPSQDEVVVRVIHSLSLIHISEPTRPY